MSKKKAEKVNKVGNLADHASGSNSAVMPGYVPLDVSAVDMAFGGDIGRLMPKMADIPEEFKRHHGKWVDIVSRWFFSGLPKETAFIAKPGIDPDKALRHIGACMRSFEPKHEHKEAACAYLLSLWFENVILPST